MKRISRPKHKGKQCLILVFDAKQGRHKFDEYKRRRHILSPIEIIDSISVIDARALLGFYLRPHLIPSYAKCRDMINKQGYIPIMKINEYYILG